MKQRHTIMLTYDRIQPVEIDLGIDNLRDLYGSGCLNEQFVSWIPERFAMQVDFERGDKKARGMSIGISIRALYRVIPESKIANLKIWLDGEQEPTPGESQHEPVRLH